MDDRPLGLLLVRLPARTGWSPSQICIHPSGQRPLSSVLCTKYWPMVAVSKRTWIWWMRKSRYVSSKCFLRIINYSFKGSYVDVERLIRLTRGIIFLPLFDLILLELENIFTTTPCCWASDSYKLKFFDHWISWISISLSLSFLQRCYCCAPPAEVLPGCQLQRYDGHKSAR